MSSRELLIIYCAGSFESCWAGPIFKPAVASGGECFKGTGDPEYPLLGKAESLGYAPFLGGLRHSGVRAEGLLFLHGLESNPGSSLQTEEEAGLP